MAVLAVAEKAAAPEALTATELTIIAAGLLALAMVLLFVEVLFPSFGLLTLAAIGCMVGALAAAFSAGNTIGVIFVVVSVVLVVVFAILAVRVFKGSLILSSAGTEAGSAGASAETPADAPAVGSRGVAVTTLRPSGTALIDGRRHSVVTTGEMIEPQAQIEVARVEGTRIVVKSVKA
jgi:membrane-bound serine protease (ClpP class)